MIAQLTERLAGLSGREKSLLALFLLVAMPMALVLLLVLPLIERRDSAITQLELAQVEYQWVIARHADWQAAAQSPGGNAAPVAAPAGLSGLEVALNDSGLRTYVTTLANDQAGKVSLRLDAVPFVEAGRFMELLGPALGYDIGSLRIIATDMPGAVDVALELTPVP